MFNALGRLFLAFLVLTAALAHAQTGPVGWWKFDEGSGTTTSDSSGNSHPGTLANSPTWSTGRVGAGALSFNGGTSQVDTTGTGVLSNLHSTGFTVSAWIKPAGAGGGNAGRIVDKDNNSVGWFFAMSGSNAVKFTSDQDKTGSGTTSRASASNSIALNTWQHVAVTWSGAGGSSNVLIYVNGVASTGGAASSGGDPQQDDSSTALMIGNRTYDNARGFNGAIDEVRIYNRVLSASEIQTLADSTAPNAPTALSAAAASSSQINLSWTAPTDNVGVTGYLLDRCTGAGCTTFLQIASPTGVNYSDTGLSASTTYVYRVRAIDANSNKSVYSSTASALTLSGGGDTSPPTAPGAITFTLVSSNQINLTWGAATDNVAVTGYSVERCQGPTSCTTYAPVGSPTTNSYNDSAVAPATLYSYRVLAKDAANNHGPYSTPSSTTTSAAGDTQAPTTPTGLFIAAASSSEIDLGWIASTDNVAVTGYLIDRCVGSGCTLAPLTTATVPSYNDTGRSPATSYSYRVRAQDAAGNASGYSATLTYVTPASSPDCN